MVGLSVVLEAQKGGGSAGSTVTTKKIPQVINKTTMMLATINTSTPSALPLPQQPSLASSSHHFLFHPPTFLDQCFLCKNKLLPGKDIYMYKGDRAFCSVDCRCKQIFIDEEEAIQKGNCSLAAMRPTASSSASSSSEPRHHRKGSRNRGGGGGGFAY